MALSLSSVIPILRPDFAYCRISIKHSLLNNRKQIMNCAVIAVTAGSKRNGTAGNATTKNG
jgi:hypothetical protein